MLAESTLLQRAATAEPPVPGAAAAPVVEVSRTERRYAHGELLLAAFIAARRPLAFEDLASVLMDTGARVSELVNWMSCSQANGLISSQGYAVGDDGAAIGPRLYSLSDDARAELRARRTRRRARAFA